MNTYQIVGDKLIPVTQNENGSLEFEPGSQESIKGQKLVANPITKLTAEYTDNEDELVPMSFGSDGYFYGIKDYRGSEIIRSDDGFDTHETGADFNERIYNVTKTSAGFVVVTKHAIHFSESFGSGFTEALSLDSETDPGFDEICIQYHESGGPERDVFLVGEYSQDKDVKHKLYLSTDGGQSWSMIKETELIDNTINSHWHHATFDPFSGDIFASAGDGPNRNLYRSRDMGDTWETLDAENYYQPTLLIPFQDRIYSGPDSNVDMSVYSILKKQSRLTEDNFNNEEFFVIDDNISAGVGFPTQPYAINENNEAYVVYPSKLDQPGAPVYILATGDGGMTWHIVYSTRLVSEGSDWFHQGIVGPNENGNMYAYMRYNGDHYLLKFKALDWVYK